MEAGEGSASATIEIEPEEEKKPVTVRIALFYDGTLNNRVNIGERESDSEVYKEFRKENEPTSYDNGRTNIAIMEPHLQKKADGYEVCLKSYIEGQGTIDLEGDSFKGYALGGGISGVADRADEGIKRAVNLITDSDKIDSLKHYINKLTIDVFGFSRGAATARYAIHVLFDGRIAGVNQYTGELLYEFKPIHTRLSNRGYDIAPKVVEVCFAGLYDTVLSYYGSQYFKFTSNVLQQKAVARAKKVLHLAAADEHRKDFPLHNIKSAKSKGGEEYFLPGVHSDIGGSYNQANEKELQAETDETKKVYMLTTDENMVILRGRPDMVEQDRDYLKDQGWYKDDQIKILAIKSSRGGRMAKLKVDRRNIHSSYCNIPLKIMAKYARDKEVKLKINVKLEDRANTILEPEEDLKNLEGIINGYIASNKNSKPGDWINDDAPLNTAQLKKIRNKHFHFSSKPGAGYAPRIVKDKATKKYRRIRYVYDA